ncbi:hypothetical protein BT96DRAFT_1007900 [Gymnopus androsaceus JB14]|uniref:CxC2-like cysteine cluster KDZ transposase-associated domain-containing protein n=1 Tax=Gymnopus androsaceus JB14 TaxID=1447944 RepID=A0A6A4GGN5_9AGAR|nr:hypothetical protein BT96DRAFT_1007900 [Gymnopus androsaceus JB14]
MAEPPLWLCNKHIRTGIKGILLHDCCGEELLQLEYKQVVLKDWFLEEWLVVVRAMEDTEDLDILHHLQVKMTLPCCMWYGREHCQPYQKMSQWNYGNQQEWNWLKLEVEMEFVEEEDNKDKEEDEGDVFEEFDEDELDVGLTEHIDAQDLNDNVWEMEAKNEDTEDTDDMY